MNDEQVLNLVPLVSITTVETNTWVKITNKRHSNASRFMKILERNVLRHGIYYTMVEEIFVYPEVRDNYRPTRDMIHSDCSYLHNNMLMLIDSTNDIQYVDSEELILVLNEIMHRSHQILHKLHENVCIRDYLRLSDLLQSILLPYTNIMIERVLN